MITCTVCGEELPFGGAFMLNRALVLEGQSVMFVKADSITYPDGFKERACGKKCLLAIFDREVDRVLGVRPVFPPRGEETVEAVTD
jgi:hypothetical protein